MEQYARCFLVLQILVMLGKRFEARGAPEVSNRAGPVGYLICNSGFTLQVLPNKTVRGTRDIDNKYAVVQLFRAGNARHIVIHGVHSNVFLCMTNKGKIIGKRKMSKQCLTRVHELQENFQSFSYRVENRNVYFGLTHSGKPRTGKRRSSRTKFIWRPINYKEIQKYNKDPVNWSNWLFTNV